jgi:putative phage-type endonuclease
VLWLTTAAAGRGDWLAARRTGIGGSDVPAILGTSPFRSPFDVWLDKTGREVDREAGERARWGSLLEDVVVRLWASAEQVRVRRLGTVADPDAPWRVASLDRAILQPGTFTAAALLEVKTTSQRAGEAADDTDLADRYGDQVQWYLGITGLESARVVVLVGGQQLRTLDVEADPARQAVLAAAADGFWHTHVVPDTAPPLTALDYERVATVPETAGETVEADDRLLHLLTLYRTAKAGEKSATDLARTLQVQILDALGPAGALTHQGRVLATWRTQTTTRIDPKAVRAKHPDVWTECATTTDSRRLLLTKEADQ